MCRFLWNFLSSKFCDHSVALKFSRRLHGTSSFCKLILENWCLLNVFAKHALKYVHTMQCISQAALYLNISPEMPIWSILNIPRFFVDTQMPEPKFFYFDCEIANIMMMLLILTKMDSVLIKGTNILDYNFSEVYKYFATLCL